MISSCFRFLFLGCALLQLNLLVALAQQPPAGLPSGVQPATISDVDGYTNIRSAADKESKVVATVVDDEVFWFLPSSGNWCRVWKATGEAGFMSKNHIHPKSGTADGTSQPIVSIRSVNKPAPLEEKETSSPASSSSSSETSAPEPAPMQQESGSTEVTPTPAPAKDPGMEFVESTLTQISQNKDVMSHATPEQQAEIQKVAADIAKKKRAPAPVPTKVSTQTTPESGAETAPSKKVEAPAPAKPDGVAVGPNTNEQIVVTPHVWSDWCALVRTIDATLEYRMLTGKNTEIQFRITNHTNNKIYGTVQAKKYTSSTGVVSKGSDEASDIRPGKTYGFQSDYADGVVTRVYAELLVK